MKKSKTREEGLVVVGFRITPTDRAKLRKVASSYGLTLNAFITKVCMGVANKRIDKLMDFDKDIEGED